MPHITQHDFHGLTSLASRIESDSIASTNHRPFRLTITFVTMPPCAGKTKNLLTSSYSVGTRVRSRWA